MAEITEKQLETIAYIEEYLEVRFKGKTSRDAWKFINKYYSESKNEAANQALGRALTKQYKKEFNCRPYKIK